MKHEVIRLYDNREDVTLTTYVLADSPEMLDGKCRPAILICPGGAYLNCSDREAEPIAMKFAAMGYHTFVLRYSTYNQGKQDFPVPGKKIPVKEHCIHPMPMREIGHAMLIIREHATEWLVDENRIAICGFSAGAHNCAMYATHWHEPVISDYFKRDRENFRPAAVILGYTLSDYVYMNRNTMDDPMARDMFDMSNTAFLGGPTTDEAKLTEVSPARNVTENTPPTFLWATAADELVPVQHTILMARALADKKIPFEVHIFEEGPHGLSTAMQASAGAKSEMNPDAAKWIDLCDAWLMKRFAFDLPDYTPFQEMLMKNGGKF